MKAKDIKVGMVVAVNTSGSATSGYGYLTKAIVLDNQRRWVRPSVRGFSGFVPDEGPYRYGVRPGYALAVRKNAYDPETRRHSPDQYQWVPTVVQGISIGKPWDEHEAEQAEAKARRMAADEAAERRQALDEAWLAATRPRLKALGFASDYTGPDVDESYRSITFKRDDVERILALAELGASYEIPEES